MDRVTQRRKKGNRLIGQRYLLQTLLVSNSAGHLYQARDIRAGSNQDTQVLVHILLADALRNTPLKLMAERLQALSSQTNAAVLSVLDSGWTHAEPYFVLASPDSWSLSALPPMLGQTTRLHEQALQLNQQLTEQGLIKGALPTSLFLVSAGGNVYLPSTALAPSLQNLTEAPELLLQAHAPHPRSKFNALPLLGVGFIGVVAASGAGLYYQNQLMSTATLLGTGTEMGRSNLLEAAVNIDIPLANPSSQRPNSLADAPKPEIEPPESSQAAVSSLKTESTQPLEPAQPISAPQAPINNEPALTTQLDLPDPEPGDMRLALLSEQNKPQVMSPEAYQPEHNSTHIMKDETIKPDAASSKPLKTAKAETKTAAKPEAPNEYVEEEDPAVNLPSPRSPLIRSAANPAAPRAQMASQNTMPNAVAVVPAPHPAAVTSSAPLLGVVNPNPIPVTVKTVTRIQAPSTVRDPEVLTANGMSSDELVKKAYQALQANQLDEQANRGVIYFIRLLDRIDHGNPQIIRLARETSYQLHQQVRTALIHGDSEQASKKLWRAGRIIKEFNLVHLNPAQEILEHKLIE